MVGSNISRTVAAFAINAFLIVAVGGGIIAAVSPVIA